jgi:hypothetical protein
MFVPDFARWPEFRSRLAAFTELLSEGIRFLRTIARSRTALAAEVLFLRKQLTYYQEREIRPRRLTDAARLSLVFWSRFFNWNESLAIVTARRRSSVGIARASSSTGAGNLVAVDRRCRRKSASSSLAW